LFPGKQGNRETNRETGKQGNKNLEHWAQLGDITTVIDRSELDSYERQTFIEEIIESGSTLPQNKDSHEFSHNQGVFCHLASLKFFVALKRAGFMSS
jgi:hypothetical protein